MNLDDNIKTLFGEMTFNLNNCFLCGILLDKDNRTVEHIFPKWLQHKHKLWDKKLRILNGSDINYRKLIVPCCKKCNNEYLSEIEKQVRTAFDSGVEEVRNMDKTILYKWMMKIIYCLLFKELSLKLDRKVDNKMIISPDFLSKYRVMYDYMMSIMNHVTIEEKMSSIFIFDVHTNNEDLDNNFFYIDDVLHGQFAIRSNEIGIICCLGDSKVIENSLYNYFLPFHKFKLHEIQFRQLIADVFYKRKLLRNKNSFLTISNNIIQIRPFKVIYDEYNYQEYAKILYVLLNQFGFKFNDIYCEKNDSVINLMIDSIQRLIIYNESGKYTFGEIHNGWKGELFGDTNGVVRLE